MDILFSGYSPECHPKYMYGSDFISIFVTHHYLDAFLCHFVQSFSLCNKDLCIGLQKIFSFHSFLSWHGTNQNGYINFLKCLLWISSWDNL